MQKAYRLYKRRKIWYYKLPDEKTFHSTGKTNKTLAEKYAISQLGKKKAAKNNLAEYCQLFYVWGCCPHIRRLRDEKKTIGREHVRNQRLKLKKYILPDRLGQVPLSGLTRGHILDFRSRLVQITTDFQTNKILGVLKTILKEAYFRGDIQTLQEKNKKTS